MKKQALWATIIGIIFCIPNYSFAQEDTQVNVLIEQLLGSRSGSMESKVTVQEVEKAPGAATQPHRHPAPVFVYILEGELESQIDGETLKTYKKGDVFYEPAGALHKIARNPSKTHPLRFLAIFVSAKDEKKLLVPEQP